MATVNQVYALVNDARKQALGNNAVTVVDTGTLVSLGEEVFSSATNTDLFYQALCDRIGLTVVAVREYKAKYRSVYRNAMDWGAIYQKISYKLTDAVENPSWVGDTQTSPFDIETSTEVIQKLFGKIGTWSHEEKIPDYQLRTAFTNAQAMSSFIDGIFISMKNAMELELERINAFAVNTNIAGIINSGNANQKRDLLFEYNLKNGTVNSDNQIVEGQTPLTTATALENAEFLKYASMQINVALKNISSYSSIFNVESMPRHTPSDKAVLEVLNLFASASDIYLQSDTFHNELTALPNYEIVPYWQGSGTAFAFGDVSKIAVKNEQISENAVAQGGIIAFLHDIDSCATTMYDRRMNSMYNPRSEVNNYMEKATTGYAVDLSENGIVFFMSNPVPAE